MFTCLKCGRKLKTLHVRVYGDKNHYEPSGYHCETCRIYYDAKTKSASKAVYGVAQTQAVLANRKNDISGLAALENAYENAETERMRTVHEPNAFLSRSACENEIGSVSLQNSELMREWGRPDSNQRPPAPEAGILPS